MNSKKVGSWILAIFCVIVLLLQMTIQPFSWIGFILIYTFSYISSVALWKDAKEDK